MGRSSISGTKRDEKDLTRRRVNFKFSPFLRELKWRVIKDKDHPNRVPKCLGFFNIPKIIREKQRKRDAQVTIIYGVT